MRIPTTIDVLTRSIVCACVPPFLSLASPSFFLPLLPVSFTPYGRWLTHKADGALTVNRRHTEEAPVCVSRCVGDPSESCIECRPTNRKVHSALTPPRRTSNYDTLMKIPPTCFRHSPRVSIERMEFSFSCQLRGTSYFDIQRTFHASFIIPPWIEFTIASWTREWGMEKIVGDRKFGKLKKVAKMITL